MADPVRDLVSVAQATPDPGRISNWLVAYLGTRPHDAKLSALRKLEVDLGKGAWAQSEQRAVQMTLRVVQKLNGTLAKSRR